MIIPSVHHYHTHASFHITDDRLTDFVSLLVHFEINMNSLDVSFAAEHFVHFSNDDVEFTLISSQVFVPNLELSAWEYSLLPAVQTQITVELPTY